LIIKILSRLLIERGNYVPVTDEKGDVIVSESRAVLQRYGPEGYVIAELVNGDLLSREQIRTGLEMTKARLMQIKKEVSIYYFKVFLFSSDLSEEKLEILASEEYNKKFDGSHLCCMSVNIEKQEFLKYYKYPGINFGIDNQIRYFFSKDFDSNYGNVDFKELVNKKEREYKIDIKTEKPWITYILIAVNIVIWLVLEIYARTKGVDATSLLIDFGAKENALIMMGEYWRFLTPVFLHNGITHLAVNSYSLYILGTTVERLMGRGRFLFIYIMAGLMGSIASFIFSMAPSVGASGAIFGLLGALIYYGIEHPALFKRGFGKSILMTLVLNIVYGFSVPRIDNFGHFGGLIGGFLASGVVGTPFSRRSLKKRTAFTAVMAVLLSISLYCGFTNSQNRLLEKCKLIRHFYDEQNWAECEIVGEEIIKIGPKDKTILSDTLWILSAAEVYQGKYDEALEHAQMLVEVEPEIGHYLIELIYRETEGVQREEK
jgi:rhomboid protease GluP